MAEQTTKTRSGRATARRSLSRKLIVTISASVAIICAIILIQGFFFSRQLLLKHGRDMAETVLSRNIAKIESVLTPITAAPESLSTLLTHYQLTNEGIRSLLTDMLSKTPDAYGICVGFDSGIFEPSTRFFAPYVWRDGNDIRYQVLGGDNYDYFSMDWFRLPKASGRTLWSEPYFDEGATGILMTTVSVPFFRSDGTSSRFAGVTTADVALTWLQELISKTNVSPSGYAFLITKEGRFIAHPSHELVNVETIFTVAQKWERPYLEELGRRMTAGESGSQRIVSHVTGEPAEVFFAKVPETGWSMGIVIMEDELLASVNNLYRRLIIIGITGIIIMVIAVMFIVSRISRPLRQLTEAEIAFAGGKMDVADLDFNCGDEIESLGEAFNDLKGKLREKMEQLATANKRLERTVRELAQSISDRRQFGLFFILYTFFIGVFTFAFAFIEQYGFSAQDVDKATPMLCMGFLLLLIVLAIIYIRLGPFPMSAFGLTFRGSRRAIVESLAATAPMLVLILLARYWCGEHVATFAGKPFFDTSTIGPIFWTYLFVAPGQEFIARGLVQQTIFRQMEGAHAKFWAILLASIIFGVTHVYFSFSLSVLSILGGFFWGWLFLRHQTIVGVAISHFLMGNMLVLTGFWDILF